MFTANHYVVGVGQPGEEPAPGTVEMRTRQMFEQMAHNLNERMDTKTGTTGNISYFS